MELPKMTSKQEKRIPKAPGSRKEAIKGKNYPASDISLQVVGSGAPGAPTSLYVFAGQNSYMFNCGEGTQRLAQEHKVKLSTLGNIFTTHKSWRNAGGLPGMLLSLQDMGVSGATLHGPPGVHILYKDTTEFTRFNTLNLAYHHYTDNGGVFGDTKENTPMTVRAVPIRATVTTDSLDSSGTLDGNSGSVVDAVANGSSVPSKSSSGSVVDAVANGSSGSVVDAVANGSSVPSKSNSELSRQMEESVSLNGRKSPLPSSRGSKRSSPSLEEEDGDASCSSSDGSGGSQPPQNKRYRSDENTTDMAMAYICTLSPWKGKLILELCLKAGVSRGPLLASLKAGEDVTLPDGRIVRSQDVKSPDDPGLIFMVVEAPTSAHLESLVQEPTLAALQASAGAAAPQVVVHFTGQRLVEDPRYQAWMGRFPSSTTHLLLNEANSCMGSVEVHRMTQKLRFLDPLLFRNLADDSLPVIAATDGGQEPAASCNNEAVAPGLTQSTSSPEYDTINLDRNSQSPLNDKVEIQERVTEGANCVRAATLMTYRLRPNDKLDRSACPAIDRPAILAEIASTGCEQQLLEEEGAVAEEGEQQEFPVITFLGTGCSQPSKSRNMAGILLQVREDSYMILDCGEGTWGQLVRLFGQDAAADILSKLTGVYVSHKHPDHHMGLVGLLLNRRDTLISRGMKVTPLTLLVPEKLAAYLRSFHHHFEPIAGTYSLLCNNNFLLWSETYTAGDKAALCERLAIADINTCYVVHCYQAFGLSIITEGGKKIVYSGDTRPSDRLVEIGMDCDVLIHEATLCDGMEKEAIQKRHSTTSEALGVGKLMRAKQVILTHFSQRFSKVPIPVEKTAEELANVTTAYDFMTVSPSQLPRAAALKPALMKMFAEYVEEMKEKMTRKQLAKCREENIRLDLMRASSR